MPIFSVIPYSIYAKQKGRRESTNVDDRRNTIIVSDAQMIKEKNALLKINKNAFKRLDKWSAHIMYQYVINPDKPAQNNIFNILEAYPETRVYEDYLIDRRSPTNIFSNRK